MSGFRSFVVFAEMRTGSNFLEQNINQFDDLTCHGEAFNPYLIGGEDQDTILGISQQERDGDPAALLEAMRDAPGLNGFRYFHDHDPRIFDLVVNDPTCAKVVLTRNPLESYVSWKIAKQTDQWRLTSATTHIAGQIEFDPAEFRNQLDALQGFQVRLLNALQKSGQTAFYIAYEDIQDLEVINGLATYLGSVHQLEALDRTLKKQNPAPMSEKVANFDDMSRSLSELDLFNLNRTPNFEPRRAPNVPSYVAAKVAPVLFQPMRAGPQAGVEAWLAGIDGAKAGDLQRDFTQQTLRKWRRHNPGFQSFTILRHPVARAYRAFCTHILPHQAPAYLEIRHRLRMWYGMDIPEGALPADWDAGQQRAAFEVFLDFIKGNLAGQTAIRVDAAWAHQVEVLKGFASFAPNHVLIREEAAAQELAHMSKMLGLTAADYTPGTYDDPVPLAEIYDGTLEKKVRDVYQRDYVFLGFSAWDGVTGA